MKSKSKSTYGRNTCVSASSGTNEARKNLRRAQNLYREGQYRDALRHAESIYTTDPSNLDNLILLGAAHFQRRNLSESMFYSQQCVRVDPSCAEALCIMGNCLKEMNDMSSAISFYNKAIRFSPRYADAYNNLGIALFQSSKPLEAIETLEVAVSLDPSHCDALCNIATVCKTLGRLEDAKDYYLEAIKVNPECAIGWSNLGGIFNESGAYEQAITCYHHALKITPHFADAISNCANALFNKGRETNDESIILEALAKYKEALELRSDFALCRGCLGAYLLQTGSVQEARRQLRRAILQDDTMFDAMNNLSTIYFREGRYDDSLKLALRVLRCKPNHWCAYINLGNALKEKGLYSAAAISYKTSIAIRPTLSLVQSNIGSILVHLHRSEDSLEYFEDAIDKGSLNNAINLNLGAAYISLGEMENAERCIQLYRIDGRYEFEHNYNLAILHQRKGDLDGALWYGKKALDKVTLTSAPDEDVTKQTLLVKRFMDHLKLATCAWTDLSSSSTHVSLVAVNGDPNSIQKCTASTDMCSRPLRGPKLERITEDFQTKMRICYIFPPQSQSRFNNLHRKHDESRFDVFSYECPLNKTITKRIKGEILKQGIHILVYPCGVPFHASTLRLAPIQITFEPNERMEEIDFVVDDKLCSSSIFPSLHVQGVFYNQDGIVVNRSCESNDNLRSEYKIPEEAFVYACFQQPYNIDLHIFSLWMNILARAGGLSILLLVRHSEQMEVNLKAEAEKRNIDPERLIFIDPIGRQQHIERYSMIDLYLDSGGPVGQQTTICEALLSGIPALSLRTSGASKILLNLGLGDLVVSSPHEYEDVAISMQFEEDKFISIFKKLDEKLSGDSPLFDNDEWVKNYESSLEEAVARTTFPSHGN